MSDSRKKKGNGRAWRAKLDHSGLHPMSKRTTPDTKAGPSFLSILSFYEKTQMLPSARLQKLWVLARTLAGWWTRTETKRWAGSD